MGEPLTDSDLRYVVGVLSDGCILANLVLRLSERSGAIPEVGYDPMAPMLTRMLEINRALEFVDPVPALREFFESRFRHDGPDAVLRDLEIACYRLHAGSPAHAGLTGWLEQMRRGIEPASWT